MSKFKNNRDSNTNYHFKNGNRITRKHNKNSKVNKSNKRQNNYDFSTKIHAGSRKKQQFTKNQLLNKNIKMVTNKRQSLISANKPNLQGVWNKRVRVRPLLKYVSADLKAADYLKVVSNLMTPEVCKIFNTKSYVRQTKNIALLALVLNRQNISLELSKIITADILSTLPLPKFL